MAHRIIVSPRRGVVVGLTLLAAAGMINAGVRAQNPRPGDTDERGAEMRALAESLSVFQGGGSNRQEVELRPEALLRWSDPIRKFSDASMWAWGRAGRPIALFAVELYPNPAAGEGQTTWACEFISLAMEPLELHARANRGEGKSSPSRPFPTDSIRWEPTGPGLSFTPFPNAATPADTATRRLADMKTLLKRFTCTAHPGASVVLRLMSHPVIRYASPKSGLLDGAVFAFASGTNPEVLVVLEAQGPSAEKATWQYAIAPITVARFEVAIDRREVLAAPYHSVALNIPNASYFTIHIPRVSPAAAP